MADVELGRDWSKVEVVRAELAEALRKTEPPNGVAIKNDDPVAVRAALDLIKKWPNLIRAVRTKDHLTIMRAPDMRASMTPDEEAWQARVGLIVIPSRLSEEEEALDFLLAR